MRVRRQSYGNKILSSFIGALLGILMFLGSFVVLYINEGRENIGRIAGSAQEISISDKGPKGELICLNGKLEADEYATDLYLAPDNYLLIIRTVEMYSYVETKHKKEKDNLGGSTTITETYTYKLQWTSNPQKTDTYKGDADEKPDIPNEILYNSWIDQMPRSGTQKATNLKIDQLSIDEKLTISGKENLSLKDTNTDITSLDNSALTTSYIFASKEGQPSPNSPQTGDIRISYDVVKADKTGMIFGAFSDDNTISSFVTPKNKELLRYFSGVQTKEQAVAIMEQEHKTMTWILRLVGFLLMFFGLIAMTGPVTQFLSVIPVFSKISGFIFGLIAFVISLFLTTITVLLSIVLHSFWLAMAFVVLIIIITVLIILKKRKKATRLGDSRR